MALTRRVFVPILLPGVEHGLPGRDDSGVVDQDVDSLQQRVGCGDHSLHLARRSHVAHHGVSFPSLSANRFDDLVRSPLLDIHDDDPRPLRGETAGDGLSETGGAAGDQRPLPRQPSRWQLACHADALRPDVARFA